MYEVYKVVERERELMRKLVDAGGRLRLGDVIRVFHYIEELEKEIERLNTLIEGRPKTTRR